MTGFKSIEDLGDLNGKRVLVRADLNVPMRDGNVTDDTRIMAVVPTVTDLLASGANVILMSHFGRPKGERVPEMSLAPLVEPLAAAIGESISFAGDCIGEVAEAAAAEMDRMLLLENLRYHAAETENDPAFAANLAKLGDAYVNDAFSCAHRAHASTEAIAHLLPAAAGRSLAGELTALEAALGNPERPVAAVVGGAKVSTKIPVLLHLVEKVDHLVIGGGMANTFLAAMGAKVGASLCEHDLTETANEIMAAAERAGCEIHLPVDVIVAREFAEGAMCYLTGLGQVAPNEMILDVGSGTIERLTRVFDACKTLIWNGPLGAFEIEPFDAATVALARHAAKLTDAGALLTVAGGGDTVAALAHAGVKDQFSHVSTAGGAFLEWMEGRELPGVAALST